MPSLQLRKAELLPDLVQLTTTQTNRSTERLISLELQGRTSIGPDQPVPKSAQPALLTTPAAASKIDNPDKTNLQLALGPNLELQESKLEVPDLQNPTRALAALEIHR